MKAECVGGNGDSKGESVEWSWRAWAHVKVLPSLMLAREINNTLCGKANAARVTRQLYVDIYYFCARLLAVAKPRLGSSTPY